MVFKVEREEYINKTFRIEKRLLEDMEKLCDKKNISLNKLVVKCIKYAMDNLDEEDKWFSLKIEFFHRLLFVF